jgi:hypothetical protein
MEAAMRKTILFIGVWTAGMAATGAGQAASFFENRSGVGLRGSYWSVRDEEAMVQVSSRSGFNSRVDVGGGGGWISFFSGIGERGCLEFGLGALGHAEVNEEGLFSEQVHVSGVMPILVGYQHFLFKNGSVSAFQPYVSAGGGPYILSDVNVRDRAWMDDEVSVKNKVRPGVYGAVGGYFLLSSWFALQGEMRYHLVDFKPDNDFSGIELGLGMAFFWKR